MKHNISLDWNTCTKSFKKLFHYKYKTSNEKNFLISGNYEREFLICKKCNHIISQSKFKINDLYNKQYLDKTYKDSYGLEKRFNYISKLNIKKSDNKNRVKRINKFFKNRIISVLDVGSGTGVFLNEMQKKKHYVRGLDLDPRYILFLKKKNIKVFCKPLNKLRLKRKFDLITFNKVLEHVNNPVKILKQSLKFLKKEGFIYIEVPDEKARKKGKNSGEFCPDHLQIFSKFSLNQMVSTSNLDKVAISNIIEPSNKYTVYGFFRLRDKKKITK